MTNDKLTCVNYKDYTPTRILSSLVRESQSRELIIVGIGNIAGIGSLFIDFCKLLTSHDGV